VLYLKVLPCLTCAQVAFFDTSATAGALLQGLNEDSIALQNAISDKFSNCEWESHGMLVLTTGHATPLLAHHEYISQIFLGIRYLNQQQAVACRQTVNLILLISSSGLISACLCLLCSCPPLLYLCHW
jgi:hypothetical protein